MAERHQKNEMKNLPACVCEFIRAVIKKMRYRRKVRQNVQNELTAHFEDELKDCHTDKEREQKAQQLISQFGDARLLGILCRRAKKRCRPLWQKALLLSLEAFAVIFLYLLICSSRLIIGTPTIKVNYAAWLNDLVRQGRDESLNAKPYFDKAVQLATGSPAFLEGFGKTWSYWPGDMNEPQRQAVEKLLEDNSAAFETLKKGVEKPYYWVNYSGKAGLVRDKSLDGEAMAFAWQYPGSLSGLIESREFLKEVSKSLAGYKVLIRQLAVRILWEAYKGDLDGAFDDFLTSQKFANHLQGKGLLMEQLVGIAVEAIAHDRILVVLDKADVSAPLLTKAQQELQKLYDQQKAIVSFEAGKAFWYDFVQRTFTDDGRGSGRPLGRALPVAVGSWKDEVIGFIFFNYPDRQEVIKTIDRFYEEAQRLLNQTPWQSGTENRQKQLEEIAQNSFLLKLSAPYYGRIGNIFWRMKTHREALVTVVAIMRYAKEKGQYTVSLDELVAAGYLKELPMDPYSDKPLIYKRTDDDFVLYSVGPNFTDDGGELGVGQNGKPRMWADNGDWVFWPVLKPGSQE